MNQFATGGLSDLAIDACGLGKVFGDKVAVRNLTFNVCRGEVFGFLGPNGAGKSTAIKMLLGLVHPSKGQARILGKPIGDVTTRRRIGFLPEHFRFYDWLTPAELLTLHGRLHGMSRAALRQSIPALLDLVGLTPHGEKHLRNFSKGMLQRIGLAQALLNQPELIFLDEPTSGLDPMGRRLVRDIIRAQRDRGATVLVNSHLLGEVEVTCNRVAFIKDGEVVETRALSGGSTAETTVLIRALHLREEIVAGVSRWTAQVRRAEERLILTLPSADVLPDIVRYLADQGADVYEVTPQRFSLEQRFLEIIGSDGGL
ncbi:MAG: ABC transporter ATP-binding protein [Acidobacteria bacterium]|nr:ABC transporter ATP-binding protein [Acidobacteriota bacterium]